MCISWLSGFGRLPFEFTMSIQYCKLIPEEIQQFWKFSSKHRPSIVHFAFLKSFRSKPNYFISLFLQIDFLPYHLQTQKLLFDFLDSDVYCKELSGGFLWVACRPKLITSVFLLNENRYLMRRKRVFILCWRARINALLIFIVIAPEQKKLISLLSLIFTHNTKEARNCASWEGENLITVRWKLLRTKVKKPTFILFISSWDEAWAASKKLFSMFE